MAGLNRIEEFLIELHIQYQEIEDGTFLVSDRDKGLTNVVVAHEGPVVMITTKVMDIPSVKKEEFFEKLLRLNGTDLVHGAYGLDGKDVILIDTLEYETMDKGELESSFDAISLALAQHYSILSGYRTK
jgi:hypothetical protein